MSAGADPSREGASPAPGGPGGLPDRIRVGPAPLEGTVRVPGDKSLSHRVLILGALAGDPVEIEGVAPSEDVLATARCLERLGAAVALEESGSGLAGRVSGHLGEASDVLDCRNSGTAMRLLAGVAAGLQGVTVLTGDASLRSRPMGRVTGPLARMGAAVDGRDGGRLPPLVVRGGRLRGIDHESPVASAQVKSCVLLAGLAAEGPTSVTSPARSRDHTERLLRHLGVDVTTREGPAGQEIVTLTPGRLRSRPLAVPADPSSAAFWLVAAACGDGAVTAPDLGVNPTRSGFLDVLGELGARVQRRPAEPRSGEPVATVTVRGGMAGGARLSGARVVDAIDELVVLALAGAVSAGGLEVRDAAELRVKESDRLASLGAMFRALDLRIEERPDGYRVPGGQRPRGGVVDAGGDHRVAMTAAVAGTVATEVVEVRGIDAVASSYPSFLDDLRALGGDVRLPDGRGPS